MAYSLISDVIIHTRHHLYFVHGVKGPLCVCVFFLPSVTYVFKKCETGKAITDLKAEKHRAYLSFRFIHKFSVAFASLIV